MDFDSVFNFEVSNSRCVESYDMFMGIAYQGYVSDTLIQSNPIRIPLFVTSNSDNTLERENKHGVCQKM